MENSSTADGGNAHAQNYAKKSRFRCVDSKLGSFFPSFFFPFTRNFAI
jgi:hypothetical protein